MNNQYCYYTSHLKSGSMNESGISFDTIWYLVLIVLKQRLPSLLSSDDEREILALMCRVHELEADKMALQSERLVRQHELRRRDLLILRYDRQRHLCEEIITRQRQVLEGLFQKIFYVANVLLT